MNLTFPPFLGSGGFMSTTIWTDTSDNINSDNYWGFVLKPFELVPMESDEDTGLGKGVQLMACCTTDVQQFFPIAIFSYNDYDKAVDALASLLHAVYRRDNEWDVRNYLTKDNLNLTPFL